MERAIYPAKIEKIKDIEEFNRVYFGNEFCRFLIPTENELKECIAKIKNKQLTLTTPIINDLDYGKINSLFNILEKLKPSSEVVVNDLGVLEIIKDYKLKPVLGRLLFNRVFTVFDKIYLNDADTMDILKINRVELSNYEKPIINNLNVSISLHIPYAHIATTRLCVFNDEKHFNKNNRCKRICKNAKIRYPTVKDEILLKGNSQFMEKRVLLKQNVENIDRLVISRELP